MHRRFRRKGVRAKKSREPVEIRRDFLRFYWRIVEWFGSKTEADALSLDEVDELAEHWSSDPPLAMCVRHYMGIKPERQEPKGTPVVITEAQWEQLKRAGEAHAAMNGRA